ncbi:hypothetical protein SLS58_009222 [Diplodia intermedia]|uniref:Uncharacterized protein n=1 Tax=Diplodia intermedia TaxID=856260 RepID=A0ABR3TE41_9PEZI
MASSAPPAPPAAGPAAAAATTAAAASTTSAGATTSTSTSTNTTTSTTTNPAARRALLLSLTRAQGGLEAAKRSIAAGLAELHSGSERDDAAVDQLRLLARQQLLGVLQDAAAARTTASAAGTMQPADRNYCRHQLRQVLRLGRAAMGSTHADFQRARRNCPHIKYRLERVVERGDGWWASAEEGERNRCASKRERNQCLKEGAKPQCL